MLQKKCGGKMLGLWNFLLLLQIAPQHKFSLSLSVLTVYIYIHASCGNPSLVAAGTYQRLHIRFPPLVCLPEMLLPRDLLLLTTPKTRQTVAKINRIQRRALVDV